MAEEPQQSPASAEELIAAVRAGLDAFEQLFKRYESYLSREARAAICPELETTLGVSGAVQEALLRAWRAFPTFRGKSDPELRAWMRSILLRTLRSERRRLHAAKRAVGREQDLAGGGSGLMGVEALADPNPTPSSEAGERELLDRFREAVRRLPDEQRLALLLHKQYGLSDAQVAEALNRTPAAVKEARRRALIRLRRELRSDDEP